MVSIRSKNIFALVALLSTLWAVVATSKGSNNLSAGSFKVTSDCVTPIREAYVNVQNGMVVSGGASSYTDFGFPTSVVNGSEVAGSVGFVQRVCVPTYSDEASHAYVYSCYDNGAASCTIAIQ
jgi:hypothetical protein